MISNGMTIEQELERYKSWLEDRNIELKETKDKLEKVRENYFNLVQDTNAKLLCCEQLKRDVKRLIVKLEIYQKLHYMPGVYDLVNDIGKKVGKEE